MIEATIAHLKSTSPSLNNYLNASTPAVQYSLLLALLLLQLLLLQFQVSVSKSALRWKLSPG